MMNGNGECVMGKHKSVEITDTPEENRCTKHLFRAAIKENDKGISRK